MQETTSSLEIGKVNGFKYFLKDGVKYFKGDIILIKYNDSITKTSILDIAKLDNGEIFVATTKGTRYSNEIISFYYKRDIKKYSIQKKPRIFEGDLESTVIDDKGNTGLLKDLVFAGTYYTFKQNLEARYDSLTDNTIVSYHTKNTISLVGKFCEVTKKYYASNLVGIAHVVNIVDMPGYADKVYHSTKVFVNKNDIVKLPMTYLYYISNGITSSNRTTVPVLNPEILLDDKENFVIGPISDIIIYKKHMSKDDTYIKYPSGLYFPEFDATKKLNPKDKLYNYRFGLDSATHIITEGLKYTFGVEIELADAIINENYFKEELNIKIEKDGSIINTRKEKYGPELITGVLKGDKGFEHLQKICNDICKKSAVNSTCSIHTHLGGAEFNNTTIVMLYKLARHLESDIFSMLPPSRRNNEYCRMLPNLNFNYSNCKDSMDFKIRTDNYYNQIFQLACNSIPNNKLNKNKPHPNGPKLNYNHNTIRYCWLNFIPALFNQRNTNPPVYTVEFRAFNASTNFIKIKNWIKICMALLSFAENNYSDIMNNQVTIGDKTLPLTLTNLITKVYPRSHRSLNKFIEERTQRFCTDCEDIEDKKPVYNKIKELA